MFEQALDKLGLATPFVYAAGTYYFFHYLDTQASAQAKQAISGWFKPLEYDRAAVAAAVVEIFDRLYTRPLLGWRAALRSALFTIVITAIFAYEILSVQYVDPPPLQSLAGLLLMNIVSDYVSLFIVRWLLVVGGKRPTVALLVGPLAGMFVVLLFALVREIGLFAFWATPDVVASVADSLIVWSVIFFLPTLAVHLWLPLFGFGLLCVTGLKYLLQAIGGVRWFLERGDDHPLDAVGYVLGTIVFVGAGALQLFR
jgi:hypothetical protein